MTLEGSYVKSHGISKKLIPLLQFTRVSGETGCIGQGTRADPCCAGLSTNRAAAATRNGGGELAVRAGDDRVSFFGDVREGIRSFVGSGGG